jgi:hypothetical protein
VFQISVNFSEFSALRNPSGERYSPVEWARDSPATAGRSIRLGILEDPIPDAECETIRGESTSLESTPVLVFIVNRAQHKMVLQGYVEAAARCDYKITAVGQVEREVELTIA